MDALAHLDRTGQEVGIGDGLQALDRRGARHRVAAVGVAGEELRAGFAPEGLRHAVGHEHHRQRTVAAGDALAAAEDVWPDARVLGAKPFAGAAEAGDDLVEDEQDVVLVAHLAQRAHVAIRWDDDAGRHQDRLGDDGRDGFGPFQFDRRFEEAAIDFGSIVG